MALHSDSNTGCPCGQSLPSSSQSVHLQSPPAAMLRTDSTDSIARSLDHSTVSFSDKSRIISPKSSQESLKSTPTKTYGPLDEKNVGSKSGIGSTTTLVPSIPLPNTRWTHRQWARALSLHWLSAYRVLIGLTFAINHIVFGTTYKRISLTAPLIATAANIFAAVVVRQEDIINFTFTLVAKTSSNLPMWLGKIIADFHHYGGFRKSTDANTILGAF